MGVQATEKIQIIDKESTELYSSLGTLVVGEASGHIVS